LQNIKGETKMNSLSEDERRYIAEVLSGLAKLVMTQLAGDFQVEVKTNNKEVPLWLRIQVEPYIKKDEEESSQIS